MRHAHIMESALRAAVLQALLGDDLALGNLPYELKTRSKLLVAQLSLTLTTDERAAVLSQQNRAVDGVVDGMSAGFHLHKHEPSGAQERRASFESDRSFGVATFLLPKRRENKSYSKEERFIKNYLEGLKSKNLLTYFGFNNNANTQSLSIALPLFKLRNHFNSLPSDEASLDRARLSAHVFFDTLLSENIGAVDQGFSQDSRVKIFFESLQQQDNYLNDRRLIELVIISASNALWFLMEPVNEHGISLSTAEKIELCKTFIKYLYQVNNDLKTAGLHGKGHDGVEIQWVIRDVIVRMKQFKSAFLAEQKSQLSLNCVSDAIKQSLGHLNEAVLVFAFDDVSQHRSASLPEIIKDLVRLIAKNKELLTRFKSLLNFTSNEVPYSEPVANVQAKTVVDVLILFSHATPSKKQALIDALSATPNQDRQQLSLLLSRLDEHFIMPVYRRNESLLGLTVLDRARHKTIAQLSAKQLMPLFCMVIDMCQIELEPRVILGQEEALITTMHSSVSQCEKIKRMRNEKTSYYDWSLAPLLVEKGRSKFTLSHLPQALGSILALLQFNDHLKEALIEHPKLLLYPSVLHFINRSMDRIKYKYHDLLDAIDLSNPAVKQCALRAVTVVKNSRVDIRGTIKLLLIQEGEIILPEDAKVLQLQLNLLNEKHQRLFGSETGIEAVTSESDNVLHEITLNDSLTSTPSGYVAASLLQVIQCCHQSLSMFMASDRKSLQLLKLERLVKELECISTFDDAKHLVGDLAKIVMVSRSSCTLFQAEPGFSNSAKCLYGEMKRLRYDDEFPLAKLLLGDSFNIHEATDEDIRSEMQQKFQLINGQRQKENIELSDRTP